LWLRHFVPDLEVCYVILKVSPTECNWRASCVAAQKKIGGQIGQRKITLIEKRGDS